MPKKSTKAAVAESKKTQQEKTTKSRKRDKAKHEEELDAVMSELTAMRVTMGLTTIISPAVGVGVAAVHEYADDNGVDLEIGESGIGFVTLGALVGSLVALGASDGYVGVGVANVGSQASAADTSLIKYRKSVMG